MQTPTVLNAVSLALFAAVCVGIAVVALTAPRRPRVAQLCFLVVAGFLLTNKVWSPQYSLWLVPLAVLALPHRRILLAWMTVDALVWVPRMYYYLGVGNKGLPEQWFTGAVVVRDLDHPYHDIGLVIGKARKVGFGADDFERALINRSRRRADNHACSSQAAPRPRPARQTVPGSASAATVSLQHAVGEHVATPIAANTASGAGAG